jgi:hypothetical protein
LDDPPGYTIGLSVEEARDELDYTIKRACITSTTCRMLNKNCREEKLPRPLDWERLLLRTQ